MGIGVATLTLLTLALAGAWVRTHLRVRMLRAELAAQRERDRVATLICTDYALAQWAWWWVRNSSEWPKDSPESVRVRQIGELAMLADNRIQLLTELDRGDALMRDAAAELRLWPHVTWDLLQAHKAHKREALRSAFAHLRAQMPDRGDD